MKVERLTIRNFRNIGDSTFSPDPTINFLIGSNGQGKTSFIEALSFLSTLRSFRDSKVFQLIQRGSLLSDISCTLSEDDQNLGDWKTKLRVTFQLSDQENYKTSKTAYVNDKPYKSSILYLNQRFKSVAHGFHAITFNPSDHDLVRGEPAIRRSYLDRVIAAEDFEYLKIFQKYHRVLIQRNALLKSGNEIGPDVWAGFTEPLCTCGAYLALKRLEWIQRIAVTLNETLTKTAPFQPALRMTYLSSWIPDIENLSINNNNLNSAHFTRQGPLPSLKVLEQSFWSRLSTFDSAERRLGHTLVGPHRDDWAFFLGDQVLKGHGSQGEIRSALLALKLSEIVLFRDQTGQRPLFLLDDFSSELDQERRTFLLRFLRETDLQTFVTTTEDSAFIGKKFWVNKGIVSNDDRRNTVRFG